VENDKKVIGIEIWITQETDEHTHSLFRIYNTHEINKSKFKNTIEKFKSLAIEFVRGKKE